MIKGEYKSPKRAQDYSLNRFKGGLAIVNKDEMEIIENWLSNKISTNKTIFDLGAGTGRAIRVFLKSRPKTIYAFDQSPAMLKLLKENYPTQIKKGQIKVIVGLANKIALDKNCIDIVVSLHVFKHLKDINPALKEVNRILKNKGFIIFDVLNINSLIKFNLGTCYALTKPSIIKILSKNGFNCLEIVPLHVLGETVYNFPGAHFINFFDKFLTKIRLPIGTKFFVLAQKNV